MSLVKVSLDDVTVAGVGEALLFNSPKLNVGMQVLIGPGATGVSVVLEATLDGVVWIGLAEPISNEQFVEPLIRCPVLGIRANLTQISGTGTVKATLVATAD